MNVKNSSSCKSPGFHPTAFSFTEAWVGQAKKAGKSTQKIYLFGCNNLKKSLHREIQRRRKNDEVSSKVK